MNPELYLMIDGKPEFNIKDKLPIMDFMGCDSDDPAIVNNYQNYAGLDGSLFTSSSIQKNSVNLRFLFHYDNFQDYRSRIYLINQFFHQKKIYRIRTNSEPDLVMFCRPTTFQIKPIDNGSHDCTIVIPMENPSGYRYSRFDSLSQQDLWDDFPLGWDIPVMTANDFIFTDKFNFKLMNPSGVPIDPYYEHHDLKIHMSWVGPFIKLNNWTNNTSYTYFKKNDGTNNLVLDGINTYANGTQDSINSDYGNLQLEPGFNAITVNGCSSCKIKFEFPFIYV
ncbi:phage tail family protein [Fructilactobacillus hinvesii]|uniref:Phage tail family protein n=1 Tax=Fructilactobacillus hinvesii TaxID=2940300 RepID=A0ABY5BQQ8_9LACO|nr:phage tail domain-containing protein [Fructilactobacillus hinvesii]USS87459.1 phage tail family protein [Fructilactobacillus hinvesii]